MQRFRTSVSLVFWSETPEESDALAQEIVALLPEADQPSALTTIEYVSAGRPDPTSPMPPMQPEGGG